MISKEPIQRAETCPLFEITCCVFIPHTCDRPCLMDALRCCCPACDLIMTPLLTGLLYVRLEVPPRKRSISHVGIEEDGKAITATLVRLHIENAIGLGLHCPLSCSTSRLFHTATSGFVEKYETWLMHVNERLIN